MMEFMVEMLVTAFALGGILGAVVALHLSANQQHRAEHRSTLSTEQTEEHTPVLKTVSVENPSRQRHHGQQRRP